MRLTLESDNGECIEIRIPENEEKLLIVDDVVNKLLLPALLAVGYSAEDLKQYIRAVADGFLIYDSAQQNYIKIKYPNGDCKSYTTDCTTQGLKITIQAEEQSPPQCDDPTCEGGCQDDTKRRMAEAKQSLEDEVAATAPIAAI